MCNTYYFFIIEEGKKNGKLPGEKIDYNERFWWTWDQGRFGFGPYGKIFLLTETLNTLTRIFAENTILVLCDESLRGFITVILQIFILALHLFKRKYDFFFEK
jgi:hypothetical protein